MVEVTGSRLVPPHSDSIVADAATGLRCQSRCSHATLRLFPHSPMRVISATNSLSMIVSSSEIGQHG